MYTAFIVLSILTLMPCPSHSETITVVTESWPPFNYEENGKLFGISTEIVRTTLKKAGITADFKLYPWARAYKMALNDDNILIYTIHRNPEREHLFKWVAPITRPIKTHMYKLRARTDIVIHALNDARKYTTGVMRDDDSHLYLLSRKFKNNLELDVANTEELNIKKLFHGRIDLIIQSELAFAYRLKKLGYSINDVAPACPIYEGTGEGGYMAFSRQTSDVLVQRVHDAFKAIEAGGIVNQIYSNHVELLKR